MEKSEVDTSTKILITGAAGGIGSLLAKALSKKYIHLLLVDNLSGGSLANLDRLKFPYTMKTCDVADELQVFDLVKHFRPDFILHLASTTSLAECQTNPSLAFRSNFLSTQLLLDASRKFGVQRFILASTSAVYERTYTEFFQESDPIHPELIYPLTKFFAEKITESYSSVYGIPTLIFRLFNVYGPYQNWYRKSPPLLNYLCREYRNGHKPVLHSKGDQSRDYVSVYDVVNAFERALLRHNSLPLTTCINLASGESVSVERIDTEVRKHLGISYLPVFKEANSFWNQYEELHQAYFPIDRKKVEMEVLKSSLGSNQKAAELLGWSPVTFSQGISRVLKEIDSVEF